MNWFLKRVELEGGNFVVDLLLLKTEFEVLVYYMVLLLMENLERIGYDLKMRNPVCPCLSLNMQYNLVTVGMNRFN